MSLVQHLLITLFLYSIESSKILGNNFSTPNYEVAHDVVDTPRQQNVRQSTLPVLILILVSAAFIVAFKVFLLLWKVVYYSVADPYVTSGPVDSDFDQRKHGFDWNLEQIFSMVTQAIDHFSGQRSRNEEPLWKRLMTKLFNYVVAKRR